MNDSFNPLMHNVRKWPDTLKILQQNVARFLKCIRPFWDIMNLRTKLDVIFLSKIFISLFLLLLNSWMYDVVDLK